MIQFNYLVFIGRFQPFHAGHYHVVKEALKLSSNVILVLGSHDKARDSRNPFTTQERIDIIKSCFTSSELARIHFSPQYDHTYNMEKWIAGVQAGVNAIVHREFNPDPVKIGIIGFNKDHSSFYLKMFPNWQLVEIPPFKVYNKILNSTEMRNDIFLGLGANLDHCVNVKHAEHIMRAAKPIIPMIGSEMEHVANYKKSWEAAPYPPTFVTVDTVVTQSGHILMVKRGAQPGEGLWALPGGFVNQTETLQEAAIRELKEETRIDVPVPVLVGSIVRVHTYDDPHRSTRGRTITTAYHIRLPDRNDLPRVKGSDDAAKAKWLTLSEFAQSRNKMFEDHFGIVEHMLGL